MRILVMTTLCVTLCDTLCACMFAHVCVCVCVLTVLTVLTPVCASCRDHHVPAATSHRDAEEEEEAVFQWIPR